jgi:hypothetical protein
MPYFNWDIHLPHGWSFILLAMLILCLAVAFWWRRRWLGICAVLSVGVVIAMLALLALTWNTAAICALDWSPKPEGGYSVVANSTHGRFRFYMNAQPDGPPLPWPGQFQIINQARTPNESLLWGSRFSLFGRFPFLETKVGFQLAHIVNKIEEIYSVTMPSWLAILLFCPWFPLLWYLRRRRRLRQRGFPVAINAAPTPPAQIPST